MEALAARLVWPCDHIRLQDAGRRGIKRSLELLLELLRVLEQARRLGLLSDSRLPLTMPSGVFTRSAARFRVIRAGEPPESGAAAAGGWSMNSERSISSGV